METSSAIILMEYEASSIDQVLLTDIPVSNPNYISGHLPS
jgi:hypothetical protein